MPQKRRTGPAGLLIALFVVGGLIFSYGLGHGPPERVCTQHTLSAPVPAASATTGTKTPEAGISPLHGLHSAADAMLKTPQKHRVPLDACLCVAALFTLILLGLAAILRRPTGRLPARIGWTLVPAAGRTSRPLFRPALQVLRL